MTVSALALCAVTGLLMLYRGWNGWRCGATSEGRHFIVNLFAVLFAIRFWQPCAETVAGGLTFDPRWIATGTFVILYAAGGAIAGFVVNLKGQSYRSVQLDLVNNGLGVLAGLFSGALLGGCLFLLVSVGLPGEFDAPPPLKNFAAWPENFVRGLETNIAGIAPTSPARTQFPQVTLVEVPVDAKPGTVPDGAVLMQVRGKVTWQ